MITREAAQMMIDAMDSIPAMKRNCIHGELKELALTIRELYDKCEGMHNSAIDKAVEVAKKTFTACSKNPTATPCNEMVAEELKKLKEV